MVAPTVVHCTLYMWYSENPNFRNSECHMRHIDFYYKGNFLFSATHFL